MQLFIDKEIPLQCIFIAKFHKIITKTFLGLAYNNIYRENIFLNPISTTLLGAAINEWLKKSLKGLTSWFYKVKS